MSEGTPITRQGVEFAYRFLLGRAPENERAYEYGLSAGTVETLRRWIMSGPEYAQRIRQDAPQVLRQWVREELQAVPPEPEPEPAGVPRIVFLHIMKTAGSSIRLRLEELVGEEPVWRVDQRGEPGRVPPAELAGFRLVMGHMSLADARHVPPPRRIFTVLREPKERLVSLYHFLARHRPDYAVGPDFERARIARASTLVEFLANPAPIVRHELQNMMTRILAGGFVPVGPNRYRQPWHSEHEAITGTELLHIALGNLLGLHFVTFVDRLEEDRPLLMAALGLPDPGPFPRENTRETVNDTIEPREPPEVTPEASKYLNRLTDLDRVLYQMARAHRWSPSATA